MSKQELHPRTAVLNKNQKNQSKHSRSKALLWLVARFPAAFDNSLCIRPLKAGIMEDILLHADEAIADGISRSKLREAVVLFTRRLDYLACLKCREMRIDLQGNSIAEVTIEEAELAATKIKKRVEKSARNARKILNSKTQIAPSSTYSSSHTKPATYHAPQSDDVFPTYPSRSSSYPGQHTPAPIAKTPSIVVKTKATRQYDPSAVARLKEKLGLSRSMEEQKEMVE